MSRRRKTRRRLIILGILVIGLVGLGILGKRLYDKELTREGVVQKAQRMYREGNFDESARLSREALEAQPDNLFLRQMLLEALHRAGRLDETREVARKYFDEGEGNEFAGVILCQLAMRRGDVEEADKVARRLVDMKPDTAYQLIGFLQDLRGLSAGDWRVRLAAASTLRNLASLTESESVRADSLLFSAEILLEIAPLHPNPAGLERRARADLTAAEGAAARARQKDRTFNYDLAVGRIRCLSSDEEEAEIGANVLRKYTSGANSTDRAVTALALHHIRRQEWTDATTLIQATKDPYHWYRMFWSLRRSAPADVTLSVLEASPHSDPAERDLLGAEVLLGTEDEASRKKGREMLSAVVNNKEATTAHVLRALLALATRINLDVARDTANAAKLYEREDPRVRAFLATLLATSTTDRDRGLEMIRRLVSESGESTESRNAERIISGSTGAALEGWLDARIEQGGENAYQYRLRRAMTLLAQARAMKDKPEAKELRVRVRDDIDALLNDPKVSKVSLVGAFDLASSIGERELAGRAAARAVVMKGSPSILDQRLLQLAVILPDVETAKRVAAGVREEAKNSPASAYLNVLADGIESRGTNIEELGAAFETAGKDKGSAPFAYELAARIAFGSRDFDRAQRLAQASIDAEPGRRGAIELVGGVHLIRKEFQKVLDTYEPYRKSDPGFGTFHCVGALLALGNKDEALARSRELIDLFPRAPAAHFLLARVYIDRGEKRKALSVLSIAPLNTYIAHMRAELLQEVGDDAMAEQLYVGLLVTSNYRDLNAWAGLRAVLARANRTHEFAELTGKVLDSKKIKLSDELRSTLFAMRGSSFELEGRMPEALQDYEDAVRANPRNWQALNNAAWHIAQLAPSRAKTARDYIERAIKLANSQADKSGLPTLYDTAAEVCAAQGEFDAALKYMDNALALKPAGKIGKYMVHKARILLRMEREDDAKAILEKVAAEFGEGERAAVVEAREVLREIELKNLPDEEEEDDGGGEEPETPDDADG